MPAKYRHEPRTDIMPLAWITFVLEGTNHEEERLMWNESIDWCVEQFGGWDRDDRQWTCRWPFVCFLNRDYAFAFKMRWL